MGLMDRVKQQAGQALQKAQQGVSQGHAKLDHVQAKRQAEVLLRDLGAAYFAEHRQGGPTSAVDEALAALDEHVAVHGPLDTGAPTVSEADSPAEEDGAAREEETDTAVAPAGAGSAPGADSGPSS